MLSDGISPPDPPRSFGYPHRRTRTSLRSAISAVAAMPPQISTTVFAGSNMPLYCDYRKLGQALSLRLTQYHYPCEYRINLSMEHITPDWLKEKLDEKRGLAAELAESTSLTADKISKILSKDRRIQHKEAVEIAEFFAKREGMPEKKWIHLKNIMDSLSETDGDRVTRFAEGLSVSADQPQKK